MWESDQLIEKVENKEKSSMEQYEMRTFLLDCQYMENVACLSLPSVFLSLTLLFFLPKLYTCECTHHFRISEDAESIPDAYYSHISLSLS